MLVALYARVSTQDQNCELQLADLRDYAIRHGWTIAQEYIDQGVSGGQASRPALDALLNDARAHRFDAILVWKLDRFGRSVRNISNLLSELDARGIRFIATTQGLDTDKNNPMSRFMLNIMAAFAELELEMIRERTKAGMATAAAAGHHAGRPKRVFRIDHARELRDQGKSWSQIAAALNVPVGTVRNALSRATPATTQKHPTRQA